MVSTIERLVGADTDNIFGYIWDRLKIDEEQKTKAPSGTKNKKCFENKLVVKHGYKIDKRRFFFKNKICESECECINST